MRDKIEENAINFNGPQKHTRTLGEILRSIPRYIKEWLLTKIASFENTDEYEDIDVVKLKQANERLEELRVLFGEKLRSGAKPEEIEEIQDEIGRLNRQIGELEARVNSNLEDEEEYSDDEELEEESEDLYDYFGRLTKYQNLGKDVELEGVDFFDLDNEEDEKRLDKLIEEEGKNKTPQEELVDSIKDINDQFPFDETASDSLGGIDSKNTLVAIARKNNMGFMKAPQEMLNFDFDSMITILKNVEPKLINGVCCPIDKKTGKMIVDENVQIQIVVGLMWYKVNALFNRKGLDANYGGLFNDLVQSIIQNYYIFNQVDLDLNMIRDHLESKAYQETDIKAIETMLSIQQAQKILEQYIISLIVRKQLGEYEQFNPDIILAGVSLH